MCCKIHVQYLILKLNTGTCTCIYVREMKMSCLDYRIRCLGGVSEVERQRAAGQAHTW